MILNQTLLGDALTVLKTITDNSIDCCVTSPPYWGLRDYGVEGQLGLEDTPEEFISKLTAIFDEVKRVLKPEGTLWLNLGDSYASKSGGYTSSGSQRNLEISKQTQAATLKNSKKPPSGMKPKDMVGIPWMAAFALRSAGWYLRQDIIWSKPNPMPESVTDRCTKAHEYIFLLSKSKKYYYDHEAIKTETKTKGEYKTPDGWDTDPGAHGSFHRKGREKGEKGYIPKSATFKRENSKREAPIHGQGKGTHRPDREDTVPNGKANKRSVWEVPTQGYKEAHFATYPEKLIVDCIKAGCPEFVCDECGKPMIREYDRELVPTKKAAKTFVVDDRDMNADKMDQGSNRQKAGHKPGYCYATEDLGLKPSCTCEAGFSPGTVLDPFAGANTTGITARKLNRNYISIELNPEYKNLGEARENKSLGPLFN